MDSDNAGKWTSPVPAMFDIIDVPSGFEECKVGDYPHCRIVMDYLCIDATRFGGWYELTDAFNTELWFTLLQLSSGIACFVFFMLLYNTKELQVHPMKLIMYIAFMETIVQFALILQLKSCEWNLNVLFAYTVYFDSDIYYQARALCIQIISTIWLAVFATFMTVMLNMMLSIDLILTVRYPFKKKDDRNKIYVAISVLFSLVYTCGMGFSNDGENFYDFSKWMGIVMLSLFFAVFVVSIAYTCKKLSGPGMSKEVRNLVLKRHILTTVLYLISNSYLFATFFILALPSWDSNDNDRTLDTWWTRTLKILFVCQGFFIPLVRLSEPYFYEIIGHKISKWCS